VESRQPTTMETDGLLQDFLKIDEMFKTDVEQNLREKMLCLKKYHDKPEWEKLMQPFNTFNYYCVVTTPEMPLPTVKERINKGLSDTGFSYKLPEFEELDGKSLTW
jgi:hypothetical protein